VSTLRAEEVRSFLLEYFSDPMRGLSVDPAELPDSFDLLSEGVVDSLGILEMVSAVEEKFGIEVDLEDIDPDDLTRVEPFCRYVVTKGVLKKERS
jgi:acyl carrier protein